MKALLTSVLLLSISLFGLPAAFSQPASDKPQAEELSLPPAVTKTLPGSIEDLKAIQEQTKKVLERVMPAVVGIEIGGAFGSGVIINKEGLILTAGHVSGKPGQKCTIILSNGKRLEGKSLGRNGQVDSGMIKIVPEGKWDTVEMGQSNDLKPGRWCIAIGHPNGYQKGRTPVVRLGRVLSIDRNPPSINTDCTLVGGDSGGPLFDMQGKVIGIHSRIGTTIKSNVHVPIAAYIDEWEQLVAGDDIIRGGSSTAYLGVTRDEGAKECKFARITEGSPAEKAGLKAGDVVVKFDAKDVKDYDEMLSLLNKKKPGDEIELKIKRGSEAISLKVKLGRR